MAVIQKIRNKYAKVAGFVIALSLVGFILMDAASGRFGELFGRDNSVAKVNGEKIDVKDYSQRVKDYETLYEYSSRGKSLDDAQRAQVNTEALNDLVNGAIINAECDKLGIQSTKEEEKELIYGANPDPIVQQYPPFTNPETKMFDPRYVKAFEQQVDQQDPTGKAREQWETIKAYVLRANRIKKYNALLTRNIYQPKFITDYQLKEQTEMASIRFVKIPYASIDDKQVTVKDEDIEAFMKKHKAQFTSDATTRSIEYVSFEVNPTAEDTARALGALQQLKNDFITNTETESFVNRNSDEPYNNAFVNKKSFMSFYADSIMKEPVGTVYGPYFEQGAYKLTKVIDKRSLPDSSKCRHILIKTAERGQPIVADSIAKKRMDSVVAAINSGVSFDTMVQKVSEDEGSKATNGEYTFTLQQRPQISTEFGDFIFDGKVGEKKVVKVDNQAYAGYHYIEILEQKGFETSAKLATISKSLYAGDNTENAVYAKATEFAGKNSTAKAFDEAIKTEKLDKRIGDNVRESDFSVPGLGSAREVVRWMYEAKVGDVSPVFNMEGRYVVAKLADEQEAGLLKINDNLRQQLTPVVRSEKKAEMIKAKYKSATSLDAIAQASAQPIQQADSFNASQPYAQKLGYEPKVVGYTFYNGFKPNTLSPAIQSQEGVIYFTLLSKMPVAPNQDPSVAIQQRAMAENQLRNTMSSMVSEMLKKSAKIKYNPKNL